MKHKVAELLGTLLDVAVAKAEGRLGVDVRTGWGAAPFVEGGVGQPGSDVTTWSPSKTWSQGGPIIERERIATWLYDQGHAGDAGAQWRAMVGGVHGWDDGSIVAGEQPYGRLDTAGPTLLVAAMRAYVASKLGEEVELA